MSATVSLGEMCSFMGGGTPSRKIQQYWNGNIPWATVKDFRSDQISATEEFISQEGLDNSASKIVPSGTVLLVTRVGLGRVAIASIDLAINQDIKAVIPSKDILPEFLFWSLKNLGPQIEKRGTGATVKGVTLRDIKDMEIPLLPLDEQRRIVAILNRAAKIERLRARTAERLQEFIPALFIRMFGDPVENPMGWESRPLGEFCILTQYGTSKKANDRSEGLPVLRMGNITYGGELDCTDLKCVVLAEDEIKKYALRAGDILFNRTNSKELVGKTGVWDGRFEAVSASYFIRLRLDGTVVCPTYVCGFMNSAAMKHCFFTMARGAIGQANINAKELKSLPIPVPPFLFQRRYEEIVKTVRAAATVAETGSGAAFVLNNSLMSRLLGDFA